MNNLYIVGFMGAGKSTIGSLLKEKTKQNFYDLDKEIEKSTNLKISKIFEIYGERYFRKLETKILKNIAKQNNYIVSTGGGTILKRKNLKIMQKSGTILFLNCKLSICLNRIKNKNARPLLLTNKQKIENMFNKRQKKYLKIANITVENYKTKKDCLNLILEKLKYYRPLD